MSVTDELRRMLDERGVEYKTDDRNGFRETTWCGTAAFQLSPTAEMTMIVTPEQAIAATLGRGTGEWVLEHSGTLYDKWRCSKCGYLFVEPRCDQGYTDLEPNYCPTCGARVVGRDDR